MVNYGLVFTAVGGERRCFRFHTLGVFLNGGVYEIVLALHRSAEADVVEADKSYFVADGKQLIAYQQAAVSFAVGTQHETVVGDVRAGIVTCAEIAERVNDKRVFVEIVHAGNFRTENVCTCFCAELVVVVNHHRFRTCGIGAVYDNAFCCRLDSLLRNGNLLVRQHNVADLGKICRICAAD